MFAQEVGPDLDVAVLDCCQSPIQVALLLIRFGVGEEAIQVRGIRLVLPMMLECVKVGSNRRAHDRKLGGTAIRGIAVGVR